MIFTPVYYREDGICEHCEYLSITTQDGVTLEGVVYEPHNPKATLLFFAGRSDDSIARIHALAQQYKDIRIVTFNYRSYGKSEGIATEENLFADALHIAHLIQKHYGTFYLLGFSLGSSIAAYVAAHHENKGVFLVGAFDSIASLMKQKYGIALPLWCLRYRFDTQSFVKNIQSEVSLFVSQDDAITYISNARKLKDAIPHLGIYKEFKGLEHKELLYHKEVVHAIYIKVIDG